MGAGTPLEAKGIGTRKARSLVICLTALSLFLLSCKNATVEEPEIYVDCSGCFETVWQTVNDRYFDPSFGGLDWAEVHDRYKPLIAAAESDEEFYKLLNQMLFELNVSHVGAVPPDDLGVPLIEVVYM